MLALDLEEYQHEVLLRYSPEHASSLRYMYSELEERILRSGCDENAEEVLRKAFWFTVDSHHRETRESGEPFVNHPIGVFFDLMDLCEDRLDLKLLVPALHHDIPETYLDIEEKLLLKGRGKENMPGRDYWEPRTRVIIDNVLYDFAHMFTGQNPLLEQLLESERQILNGLTLRPSDVYFEAQPRRDSLDPLNSIRSKTIKVTDRKNNVEDTAGFTHKRRVKSLNKSLWVLNEGRVYVVDYRTKQDVSDNGYRDPEIRESMEFLIECADQACYDLALASTVVAHDVDSFMNFRAFRDEEREKIKKRFAQVRIDFEPYRSSGLASVVTSPKADSLYDGIMIHNALAIAKLRELPDDPVELYVHLYAHEQEFNHFAADPDYHIKNYHGKDIMKEIRKQQNRQRMLLERQLV